MAEAEKTAKTMDPKLQRRRNQIIIIAAIVVIVIVCHFITGGKLLTQNNVKAILTQMTYPLILGLGMMFIFSTGAVDLSIGAQVILGANVGATFVMLFGLGYPGLIIGAIVTVILCEVMVTFFSQYLNVASWVAGLGGALVFEALGTIWVNYFSASLGSSTIYLKECTALGEFPTIFIIAIIVFVVAYFIFNYTKFGFNLRAIGGGGEVAEAMGINKKKTVFMAAIIGATIIGIGTITQLSYTGRFSPSSGMGSLSGIFKSLAVVLLSGSFSRIFNDAVGCLVGAFIVAGLFNVLTLLGIPAGTGQDIALGVVVLACGILASIGYKGVQK